MLKPFAIGFLPDRWEGGIRELSHVAEYIYFRLCSAMWASGKPVHVAQAAAVCRFHPETDASVASLVALGKITRDGDWLFNDRAITEHNTAKGRASANSERARIAAQARHAASSGDAPSTPQALLEQCSTPATPTPTLTPTLEPTKIPCKASSSKPPTKRGSRLPEGWEPNEGSLAFAKQEGFSEIETLRLAAGFRDYWHALGGQKACKLDWDATWRNWVRNSRRPNGFTPKQVPVDELFKEGSDAHP